MNADTQRLLDELEQPSHLTIKDAQTGLLGSLDVLRRIDAQAGEYEMLVRRAELTERDPTVCAKFEEGKQLFAALMRVNREMSRLMSQATGTFGSIAAWLNGVPQEQEIVDPDATEKAKQLVMAAHDELAEIDGDSAAESTAPALRSVLKDLEPQLARGITSVVSTRSDGLRSVAKTAGYETRGPKKGPKKKG